MMYFNCKAMATTVQLTSKFTETPVLFCVPQQISQITLVMFSSARGTHEYWNARINIYMYSSACLVMLISNY